VFTSEHLHGVKINDIAGLTAAGLDRARIARNSMELILQEIFTDGFFHSDPHPGNFFALPGEVIGAVDFGQVGVLDRETTRNLVMLLSGLVNRDTGIALHALEQMGTIHRRHITPALRRDMQRLTDRFVDRPLAELSARETLDQLMGFIHRHHLTLPGPLAVLFKALVMMEGTGLQIDPTLDVFRIARPYVEQIATEQISPGAFGERVIEQGRAVSTAAIELPQQVNDLLRNLNEGNLVVQTRDQDLRRIAAALIGFANRLAVALVLTALIIALGLLAVAVGIGQWRGWMPITLAVLLLLGIVVNGLILGLALLRGRDV
jgi:ubiquinone biosynthesis protein